MKKIIYDCDNTMGIQYSDVDDALTLLYLIGRKDTELLGITTTFGNGEIDAVYHATRNLLEKVDHDGIPLIKGGPKNRRKSQAADFLAAMADLHAGDITILATGALTNLYGAYMIDNDFFKKCRDIVVMGGLIEPLVINQVNCDEVNFSCDPEAAFAVLSSPAPTTVITGKLCLNTLFGENEFRRLEENRHIPVYNYIHDPLAAWRDFMKEVFKTNGFYNWDMVAGVYTTHPELFTDNHQTVVSDAEHYRTGYLKIGDASKEGYELNIPTAITDVGHYNDVVFDAWKNVKMI